MHLPVLSGLRTMITDCSNDLQSSILLNVYWHSGVSLICSHCMWLLIRCQGLYKSASVLNWWGRVVVKTSAYCLLYHNSYHTPTFEGQGCQHGGGGLNAAEINYFPCQSLLSRFFMTEKWGLSPPYSPPFTISPPWIKWHHGVTKDYPQIYIYVITFIHSRDQKEPVASRTKFKEISCGRGPTSEIPPITIKGLPCMLPHAGFSLILTGFYS